MSTLSVRLPDSLHDRVRELAKKDNISINQFISSAVAEKLSALLTEEYLKDRGRRASRRKFETALAKIKDRKPAKDDLLADD